MTGIVMTGGQSTRMGTDKARLQWNGVALFRYMYDLLVPFCTDVFLSTGYLAQPSDYEGIPFCNDMTVSEGPMAGLISCYKAIGDTLLVVPVDMPLLTHADIRYLIDIHTTEKGVTAFYNETEGVFEPLFSIWEPKILDRLAETYAQGNRSLQHFLHSLPAEKNSCPFPKRLISANTPDAWETCVTTFLDHSS